MAKELKFRQKNSNNPRDYFVPSTRIRGGITKYGFNNTDNIKTILLSILQSIANGTGGNQGNIEDFSYNPDSHTLMLSLKNGDTFETEIEAINGKDGDVITNMTVVNNKLRIFVKHYDNSTNYYEVALPTATSTPSSPQIVEVTELFSGTLEAARTYASNNRNKMFQWILQDVDEQGNSLEKIIWHTGNGRFIDAIGFVHAEEFED